MSEAQHQILQMLQEGKLTADQAMELIQAVESHQTSHELEDKAAPPLTGEVILPPPAPNMARFRRFWQIPFFIAFAALLISALGLRSLYQSTAGTITFGFACVWSIFILTFLLTLMAFMSRRATWVHLRVDERQGRSIAISLPLPLGLAGWGVNIARGFVKADQRQNLDMVADFIEAAQQNLQAPGSDPLMINIDDDDGDRVQVYIG